MRKFVQDGYIVIKLSDLSIRNSSSVFIFCMKLTLNNSDKMDIFSNAGVEHVKYFFNLIPLRKHNFKPNCSELQLPKMAIISAPKTRLA